MPKWQSLDRSARSAGDRPSVGIQANKGNLSLNKAAFELLGRPEAVDILFDLSERLVGLRPAKPSAKNYVPHKQGVSNTWLVSGKALIQAMKIDTSVARRYDATIQDGILVIDLKQGGEPASMGPRPMR